MNKILAFVVGMTKFGRKVRDFFDGKKAMLASLATALAGTATVIAQLSKAEDPVKYLLGVANDPAFLAAAGGFVSFFHALKGEKIRNEIADVKAETPVVLVEAPKA